MGAPPDPSTLDFVLRFGRALHRYGASAPRLEEALHLLSRRFAVDGQFFSTPTAIFSAFGSGAAQHAHLTRVDPGEVNLERLTALYQLLGDVRAGRCALAESSRRLDEILAAPARANAPLSLLAYAAAAGTAARFLNGGVPEIATATLIGVCTGLLALAAERSAAAARVFVFGAATLASFLALAVNHTVVPVSVYLAALAGLIVLIPGLALTTAMQELATRHLMSGTARLSGAFVTFLMIGFGVAVGSRFAQFAWGEPVAASVAPLPAWTVLPAVVITPLALAVLFRARPRDVHWVVVGSVVAFTGANLGRLVAGPQLGVFAGALALGIVSNHVANTRDIPASVSAVPGLLLLVPGGVGFQGLVELLSKNVVPGVEAVFSMIMLVIALVSGMILAGVLVPPRRAL